MLLLDFQNIKEACIAIASEPDPVFKMIKFLYSRVYRPDFKQPAAARKKYPLKKSINLWATPPKRKPRWVGLRSIPSRNW